MSLKWDYKYKVASSFIYGCLTVVVGFCDMVYINMHKYFFSISYSFGILQISSQTVFDTSTVDSAIFHLFPQKNKNKSYK